MQKRHKNRQQYFREQGLTTEKYVIPYVGIESQLDKNYRVLEIGCGECGNLMPFMDKGCTITAVDISRRKIEIAKELYEGHPNRNNLKLLVNDIYNVSSEDIGKFDLIMMRDVIEHIPNQEKFIGFIKQFLNDKGKIFFGFPPWHMPFGGHQQGCRSKLASTLPYYHILPNFLYSFMLRSFGESEATVKSMLNTKSTGITIGRFEKIVKSHQFNIDKKTIYFINPNYDVKFNLKPRKQNSLLARIPYFRNYISTCAYYVISTDK